RDHALDSFPTRRSSDLNYSLCRAKRVLRNCDPCDCWPETLIFCYFDNPLKQCWIAREGESAWKHNPHDQTKRQPQETHSKCRLRSEEHTSELQSRLDLV